MKLFQKTEEKASVSSKYSVCELGWRASTGLRPLLACSISYSLEHTHSQGWFTVWETINMPLLKENTDILKILEQTKPKNCKCMGVGRLLFALRSQREGN